MDRNLRDSIRGVNEYFIFREQSSIKVLNGQFDTSFIDTT